MHEPDQPGRPDDVRCSGKPGSRGSGPSGPFFDPNVCPGRALQEDFVELAAAVLHQCIRPQIGACCAPGDQVCR